MLRASMIQHVVGMTGQVAAALPLLLVTALLSRTQGLEQAGRFTVVVGLSAAAFSTGLWGFRSYVVLDGFEQFSPHDYSLGRFAAILLATLATIGIGLWTGTSLLLIVAIVLYRTCDSLIDLTFGFNQVWHDTGHSLNTFAAMHLVKICVLLAAVGISMLTDIRTENFSIALSGAIACIAALVLLVRDLGHHTTWKVRPAIVSSLFFHARWFAIAAVCCAIVTSAPRIAIGWMYHGTSLGVAGISLSVASFFGMAFYTTWLRYLPKFGEASNQRAVALRYLAETAGIAVLAALVSWFVLPPLVAAVFGFHGVQYRMSTRAVLIASVFFFGSMGLANLYKPTRVQWMEAIVYLVPLPIAAMWMTLAPERGISTTLLVAAAAMLVTALPALGFLSGDACVGARAAAKRAAFARISSRPIPRVVRMMTVASEAGYECLFLGAQREDGLAVEDNWQGWRVRRIGRPFPLLNGRRPLLYVRSILRFNWDLYGDLRREKPVLVHASDCETMPGAIAYKWFHGARLVYNIHDNVSQRYQVPAFVAAILNAAEGLLVLCSSAAVVPERFRRDALPGWCRHKVLVVRNAPIDPGYAPPALDGKLRIFFAGWLDWGRGLRAMMQLAETHPGIELRVAGEGAPAIVEELKRSRHLTYLGFLDHAQVIEETRRSHFVPALYDPARVINRFAASNKLAEALAVGRPVLLNREMEIAQDFEGCSCVIVLPYAEIAEAGGRMTALLSDPVAYAQACRDARAIYESRYAWGEIRQQSLQALFGDDTGREIMATEAADRLDPVGQ